MLTGPILSRPSIGKLIFSSDQSHKSKVGTIMNYQFYTHFEIKVLYIKSGYQVWGRNFNPDGFAYFCFKKSFIPKLPFFYSVCRCVWKWLFAKYCHYFSFYDFGQITTICPDFHQLNMIDVF